MLMRLAGGLLFALSMTLAWVWFEYQAFITSPLVTQSPVIIDIRQGSSFHRIIQTLNEQKLSANKHWFKLLAYQEGLINKLKAGEYELPIGMTPKAFLLLLSSGKTRQYVITFPEGWTFRQMRTALAENPHITHTTTGLSDTTVLQKITMQYSHPEGLFFPDTYQFEKYTTDLAILKRAYQKMQGVLQQEWATKMPNLPLKNAYEALILASIVEKETGDIAERPIIAGVFIRRLKTGMRLQTDPTVIYGMGEQYQGNIRKRDLRTRTPYNTYRIHGLPPTPIAMPGQLAIHAVLHPASGSSLYFVAKGNGRHSFSSSLADHNRAVNLYQRKH